MTHQKRNAYDNEIRTASDELTDRERAMEHDLAANRRRRLGSKQNKWETDSHTEAEKRHFHDK